jgi:hypothetical protein
MPMEKRVGDKITVNWDELGYPHWTRVYVGADQVLLLNHEEARDLKHAMDRVVARLDDVDALERARNVANVTKS